MRSGVSLRPHVHNVGRLAARQCSPNDGSEAFRRSSPTKQSARKVKKLGQTVNRPTIWRVV